MLLDLWSLRWARREVSTHQLPVAAAADDIPLAKEFVVVGLCLQMLGRQFLREGMEASQSLSARLRVCRLIGCDGRCCYHD
jgi:hypothetical protein